ncbi:MAG: zinc-binding dehydrogenase [Paracoccaceae bacterium]|mgnify:CR=1 FL=1
MRAAVLTEFGKPFEMMDLEQAPPGPNEVRVKIMACAVCHSDIHFADGELGGELPMVLGHEASGEIVEVGEEVKDLAAGDRVAVTLVRHCGACPCCHKGYMATCETHLRDASTPLSLNGDPVTHGIKTAAFAEETVVHASQVVKVGDEISWEAAALLACGVITGYGAATHTAEIEEGATVAVVGCGGVGLNAIQGAKANRAGHIIAVDLAEDRLEAAMAFGATDRVNASQDDAIRGVRGLTGKRGADYVIITVGSEVAINQSYRMCAPGGAIILVGLPHAEAVAKFSPVVFISLSQQVRGSVMGHMPIKDEIPKLVSRYEAGDLKLDELISARYAFDQVNEAMDATRRGEGIRNIVMIGADS